MYNQNLHFYFIGIGGSGMSGIAEILLKSGFRVSGSDQRDGEVTERLRTLGASVFIGHIATNIGDDVSTVVYSSAVLPDNPEMLEAESRRLPVVRRAEVLAELMRLKFGVAVAGAHGKTTTTSMIAVVLEFAGLDPTVVIGGKVKAIGSGGKVGKGSILVAESDESDRSFLLLKPTIAVVTNIDAEHLHAYSSMADLEESFDQFVSSVPFYGLAVLCVDDARVRALGVRRKVRKVTYGFSPDADLRIEGVIPGKGRTKYRVLYHGKLLTEIDLPVFGAHMALNSLAAIAVGLEFGVEVACIKQALEHFEGVGRRLEVIGEVGGVTVMSDYAHHPTEIKATLSAIRSGFGNELNKLHVIFQPHRYSRTRDSFAQFVDAFSEADNLILCDIYSAGEMEISGITGTVLFDALKHSSKSFVRAPDEALEVISGVCSPGDVVVCAGAGSIGALPERILDIFRANSFNSTECKVKNVVNGTNNCTASIVVP